MHWAIERVPSLQLQVGLLVCSAMIGFGCGEKKLLPDSPQARNVSGPGDSLARIIRTMLAAPDPMGPYNALMCETGRLITLHGPEGAEKIRRQVMDTIFTRRDGPARRRIEVALARKVIYSNCSEDERSN
jgi:hypothetical protein